ncbi:MAG: alpha/beta hydrolase [Candidatus Faecousia sp.]|nr:alpha/beta hydrolase [Clostridiales bacterium]MDY6179836.1 alpha/beta hydrolase [Candidatus Faecousia sp.]
MEAEFYFDSQGAGKIRCRSWLPQGEPRAVVQLVHGIAEHVDRYDHFARFLTEQGFAVVAEDHMGHGKSINNGGIQGYFHGGWFAAVADTYHLLELTRQEFPGIPYILFGHSMGSFMARTILCKYPDSGITAAVICGTGWQPAAALPALIKTAELIGKRSGETAPSKALEAMAFGSYNKRVEHKRTVCDWLTRESSVVDAYMADPLCGFTPSAGLFRDMLSGIRYIQKPESLNAMKKDLPVFFIAGGDDPVGSYGKGVRKAAEAFRQTGMQDVTVKLYPLCRHEILNEINKQEVYQDILTWIESKIKA